MGAIVDEKRKRIGDVVPSGIYPADRCHSWVNPHARVTAPLSVVLPDFLMQL